MSALATLQVGDVVVATLDDGQDLPATLSPRPFLHPVLTLAGATVTAARPDDHPHHLGVGIGLPGVSGRNYWGGPTYRHGHGYDWLDDHARQVVTAAAPTAGGAGIRLEVRWSSAAGSDGNIDFMEDREVTATAVAGHPAAWQLRHRSVLHNVSGRDLELTGPGAKGRAGAGYGGVFWRGPEGTREVSGQAGPGEDALNGAPSEFLVFRGGSAHPWSVVLHGLDQRDVPWFVRLAEYPGAGPAIVGERPIVVPAGGVLRCGLAVVVVDGWVDSVGAAGLVAAAG